MNDHFARAAYGYLEQRVQSASPLELVALLYEGFLKHVRAAVAAIEREDVVAKGEAVSRCLAIVGELRCRLNHEQGGEVATNLERLYLWWTRRLLAANIASDTGILDEIAAHASEIASAWREGSSRKSKSERSGDDAVAEASAVAGGVR